MEQDFSEKEGKKGLERRGRLMKMRAQIEKKYATPENVDGRSRITRGNGGTLSGTSTLDLKFCQLQNGRNTSHSLELWLTCFQ